MAAVTTEAPSAPDTPAVPPRRRLSGLTIVGVLLLVAGLGCLGWVAYQYFGTNIVSKKAFDEEKSGLREQWAQPTPTGQPKGSDPAPLKAHQVPGDAIALLRIPAFGDGYEVPIIEGTDLSVLNRGVGRFTSGAEPGQIGNFALAGHRVTHGQPFAQLLDLDPGDEIIVETRDAIYTYVMDNSPSDLTVSSSATWVLDPVPGKPEKEPTQALLTLTTCQDLFHSPDRSIGFGHLVHTEQK
jgi:sortase A